MSKSWVARAALLASVLSLFCGSVQAESQFGYDWDDLGSEFCELTTTGNAAGLSSVLSRSLFSLVTQARRNPGTPSARTLFQSYSNEVNDCSARTLSSAIVEIRRKNQGGNSTPAWTEYLVVTPESDGTSRVDDVLFAIRKSDTLRSRLQTYAAGY